MVYRDRQENTGRNRKIALKLEYDGAHFNGFQSQPDGNTIQDEIEKALSILIKERVRINASGRTDSGVHALEQVADFKTSSEIPLIRLCNGINGILNKNISIKNAYEVDDNFSSRFSAIRREYRYLIYNDPQRSVFYNNYALWVRNKLDIEFLQKACNFLIGKKDFASFCKKRSAEEGTIREIFDITLSQKGNIIIFDIVGNAFLHNMIRIIMGTILELNFKNRPAETMNEIIEKTDRDCAGYTASPEGLYLKRVVYSPELSSFRSAF